MNDRVRKIDVENLTIEKAEQLSKQLSGTIETRLNSIQKELDQMLKIYGLKIEIGFQVKPIVEV